MKIDHLPTEVLLEIFTFLPTYGQVSLVNKLFYDIACKVNDPNIFLRIDQRFFDRFIRPNTSSSEWLQSIETSTRQITKIEVLQFEDVSDYQRVMFVVKKFLPTVKFLKFENVVINEPTIMLEMLPMAQNTEYLEFDGYFPIGDENESSERRRCDDVLLLDKLKSLCIFRWWDSPQHLFERVPTGVLTELKICCGWTDLKYMISRQLNITKLFIGYCQERNEFATDIFDKLKLKSLELLFINVKNVSIAKLLSGQTELESLLFAERSFDSTYPDDQVMNAVTDLLNLEQLAIDVTKVKLQSFVKIRKLKKLKDLMLICRRSNAVEKMKILAESDNASLTKLTLKWEIIISPTVIAALAKSAPHLRQCHVLRPSSCSQSKIKELNAILKHFNFVEALSVVIENKPLANPVNYFNGNLKELSVDAFSDYLFFEEWLTILTAAYPNLRKLTLSILDFNDYDLEIRPILEGFTQLESVSITGYDMDIKDLNCINDLNNNLKFLSLKGLVDIISIDEVIKTLRPHFGIVIIDEDETLNMATDRYTMECERPSLY